MMQEFVGLGIDNYFNHNSDYSKPNNTRLFYWYRVIIKLVSVIQI